jgi:RimJ/RimL family protein N-acetyltransferase
MSMAPPTSAAELSSERLLLRQVVGSESDLSALHRIWSDPQCIWWGAHQTVEETRAILPRVVAQGWWLVSLRGGEVVGDVFLRPIDPEVRRGLSRLDPGGEVLELGYHFHSSAWGRGYATEAVRAVLADHPGASVWAYIVRDNARSRRVALKLGLRIVGEIDRHGRLHDLWELRPSGEWAGQP